MAPTVTVSPAKAAPLPIWDWMAFKGSRECLERTIRDLRYLDRAIKLTKKRRVAVQAGGNLGIWPKRLAESFARVLTFEPDPITFSLLATNAPERNIERHHAALGNIRTTVGISRVRLDGKPNAHEGTSHVVGDGEIPMHRVDDYSLAACDLIYLDVEGYELDALRGAEKTIRRCRPVIAVELNRNAALVGSSCEATRRFILSRGYRFIERKSADEIFVPVERAA
jgi:FkbM family methyltransferase